MNLGLIFGGRSAEHEISLASARFVARSLDAEKYTVTPVGITRAGVWVVPDDLDRALADGLESEVGERAVLLPDPAQPGLQLVESQRFVPLDFVFPIMHGTFAEDGTIQGLLEMAGVPYAGAGVLASAVGMDKELMKAAFAKAGLPQVDYVVFRDLRGDTARAVAEVEAALAYPVFVKPVNLGSSVGMTKAHDRDELGAAISLAARYDRKVIVEAAVAGREVECSLLGNEDPQASVPGEVKPANEFYDYESKYTAGMMTFTIPAPLDAATTATVREIAVQAFRAIDCCGFARCDFLLEEPGGRVVLNEINTIPGMTAMSAFPKLWEASGLSGGELVDRIVELGCERFARRRELLVSR